MYYPCNTYTVVSLSHVMLELYSFHYDVSDNKELDDVFICIMDKYHCWEKLLLKVLHYNKKIST